MVVLEGSVNANQGVMIDQPPNNTRPVSCPRHQSLSSGLPSQVSRPPLLGPSSRSIEQATTHAIQEATTTSGPCDSTARTHDGGRRREKGKGEKSMDHSIVKHGGRRVRSDRGSDSGSSSAGSARSVASGLARSRPLAARSFFVAEGHQRLWLLLGMRVV